MIRISAFADEVSQDPIEQVVVLSGHGIRHIEFRSIHGTNVLDLSESQHQDFRDLLQDRGFGLSAIGSPIGKIKVTDPFEEHLARFATALKLADHYDT
ncbi:MAG: sugar phosphate isomerase/epimerase, partial [Singulisphaera sp.]